MIPPRQDDPNLVVTTWLSAINGAPHWMGASRRRSPLADLRTLTSESRANIADRLLLAGYGELAWHVIPLDVVSLTWLEAYLDPMAEHDSAGATERESPEWAGDLRWSASDGMLPIAMLLVLVESIEVDLLARLDLGGSLLTDVIYSTRGPATVGLLERFSPRVALIEGLGDVWGVPSLDVARERSRVQDRTASGQDVAAQWLAWLNQWRGTAYAQPEVVSERPIAALQACPAAVRGKVAGHLFDLGFAHLGLLITPLDEIAAAWLRARASLDRVLGAGTSPTDIDDALRQLPDAWALEVFWSIRGTTLLDGLLLAVLESPEAAGRRVAAEYIGYELLRQPGGAERLALVRRLSSVFDEELPNLMLLLDDETLAAFIEAEDPNWSG